MDFEDLREAADGLCDRALAPFCETCGIEVGVLETWVSEGGRTVACGGGDGVLHVRHDERGAPHVPSDDNMLVSLTNSCGIGVCAWGTPCIGASVCGIGIDLASTSNFAGENTERFNRLLFTEHEREFVREYYRSSFEYGYALCFSAKEAAFKSLAAPLRTWYRTHSKELLFGLRDFELDDIEHERVISNRLRAKRAVKCLGVSTIRLWSASMPGAVLTLAAAERCDGTVIPMGTTLISA